MGLLDRIDDARRSPARADPTITITDWAKMFQPGAQVTYGGQRYQAFQVNNAGSGTASGYYDINSVVFACEMNRVMVFSEARFQYQQLRSGRPGDLFGNESLSRLEEPWPGATTRDLLARAELDVATAGNSYWVSDGPYFLRLDPARVLVLTESANERIYQGYRVGERLLGYAYTNDRDEVTIYEPQEIAHYKPIPDRNNPWVGMSWMSPCLPDIRADEQLTQHKVSQLSNGASMPYVVTFDTAVTQEQFDSFVAKYREQHEGAENAGKTLFLGGGADIKTTGQTFENLSLKATQGANETRIAASAGVPPVIVGLSEGLQAATYSNYSQARRRFVDGTLRPLWGSFAGAFRFLVDVPAGARLWYDDRDIPFLREDVKDQAEIFARDAQSARTLVDGGWGADAAIDATTAKDLRRLVKQHSGLFSVQLQPPGTTAGDTGDQPTAPQEGQ